MILNIIEVSSNGYKSGSFIPQKFFIDVPCDKEMSLPEVTRIEIPRYLAQYIADLQQDNLIMRKKLSDREKTHAG